MKKIFFIVVMFVSLLSYGQNSRLIQVDTASYPERIQWWTDAKFGMFIHFGLYAEIGYNEWAIEHFNIPFSEYDKYRKKFNPANFNAKNWTRIAKDAGMKYMVITTKHHDGFCLFDSKYTDWDIMETPYQQDLIAELSKQCKKDDIVFGTYYSMLDWHHSEYIPNRSYWDRSLALENPDSSAYFSYVKNQVGELQKNYDPQIIWFDWQKDMRDIPGLTQFWKDMLKQNPDLLINNRLAYTGKMGDFLTPENYIPPNGFTDKEGRNVPFEVCYTMDRASWGYNPYSNDFLSSRDVIRSLCHVVSKGGNFLLNVGPKPDGTIQNEFIDRLKEVGEWMKINGESIYGTEPGPIKIPTFFGKNTLKGNNLYLQVFSSLRDSMIFIPKLTKKINQIKLLEAPSIEVQFTETAKGYFIEVPNTELDRNCFVLKVECSGKPELATKEMYFDNKEEIVLNAYQAKLKKESEGLAQEYDRVVFNTSSISNKLEFEFETDENQTYRFVVHGVDPPRKKQEFQIDITLDGRGISAKAKSTIRRKYDDFYVGKMDVKKGKHTLKVSFSRDEALEFKFEKLSLIPEK